MALDIACDKVATCKSAPTRGSIVNNHFTALSNTTVVLSRLQMYNHIFTYPEEFEEVLFNQFTYHRMNLLVYLINCLHITTTFFRFS